MQELAAEVKAALPAKERDKKTESFKGRYTGRSIELKGQPVERMPTRVST